ncbi:MAG: hypothetical protein FD165_2672 [Gammaproteobacteria bacterium]|nr:MAG: hypothetical protein FD165_2672 [Gammaproteobacteria bacterium]TND01145.1 MAG: hypothetical protein FD120_2681 [Gammaproteobacteria bacterium]
MRALITLACLAVLSGNVQAAGFSDVKIIAELKAMYEKLNEQLQTMKTTNSAMNDVRNLYRESAEAYDEVVNFDIEHIENRLRRDFGNLTALDDMNGRPLRQQLDTIARELDRRVAEAPPEQKEAVQASVNRQKQLLSRYETLAALQGALMNNLERSKKDIDVRTAAQIQAQNDSILAMLNALEAEQRLTEQMAKENAGMELSDFNNNNAPGVYRAMEKSGW